MATSGFSVGIYKYIYMYMLYLALLTMFFVCVCSVFGRYFECLLNFDPHSDDQPSTKHHSNPSPKKQRALYTEESQKVKARHEAEMCDLSRRNAERHARELSSFQSQTHRLSAQVFKMNEQALQLKQQNEQLRQKVLLLGGDPDVGGGGGRQSLVVGRETRVMPASSMCEYFPGCGDVPCV